MVSCPLLNRQKKWWSNQIPKHFWHYGFLRQSPLWKTRGACLRQTGVWVPYLLPQHSSLVRTACSVSIMRLWREKPTSITVASGIYKSKQTCCKDWEFQLYLQLVQKVEPLNCRTGDCLVLLFDIGKTPMPSQKVTSLVGRRKQTELI